MVFYDNRKNVCLLPPPPLPVDELFDVLSGKNFLGHLKKNIVQRNVAEKKILASNWGMKKNSCTEKLPNPPPPPQISNGPSLNQASQSRKRGSVTKETCYSATSLRSWVRGWLFGRVYCNYVFSPARDKGLFNFF